MKIKRFIVHISILILLPVFCFPMLGFSATGDLRIKHNGKGSAVFTVESEQSEELFQQELQETINGFNTISDSNDKVLVNNVTKINEGYEVTVSFRRIDKVRIRGNFNWYKGEALKAKQSMELDQLNRWELGDINCKTDVFYNGLRGSVQIEKPRDNIGAKKIVKPHSVEGREMSVKNFSTEITEDAQVFLFQICDTLQVKKARITLPGKISHYGGDSIKIIDQSTFEVMPIQVNATVTRIDSETLEAKPQQQDINLFVGYVAFDKSISPFQITMICISCGMVALLIFVMLIYFYRRGVRCILAEEQEKKGEDDVQV